STYATGWTPDGKVIAAGYARSTLPSEQLLAIDPATKVETYEPLAQASDGTYDGSGKTLFFTRFAFQGSHTKRYQGGTAQSIWRFKDGADEAELITGDYAGTNKDPMWWRNRVYFLSDRDGTMNVWCMDEDGGRKRQITHNVGWDIGGASIDDAGRI